MSRSFGLLFGLLLTAGLLIGCSQRDPSDPDQTLAATARAESPLGSLEVILDQTTMRTVDTLTVTIRVIRNEGVTDGNFVFTPTAHGWTEYQRTPAIMSLDHAGSTISTWVYKLEPFLDGAYAVPSASINLTPIGGEPVTLSTEPLSVEVRSVFTADDEQALAEPRPVVKPPPPTDNRPWAFAGALASIFVLVVVALVVTSRIRRAERLEAIDATPPSPRETIGQLRQQLVSTIANRCELDDRQWLTDELVPVLQTHDAIKQPAPILNLLHKLDATLYGPNEIDDSAMADLKGLVAQALQSLEPSQAKTEGSG